MRPDLRVLPRRARAQRPRDARSTRRFLDRRVLAVTLTSRRTPRPAARHVFREFCHVREPRSQALTTGTALVLAATLTACDAGNALSRRQRGRDPRASQTTAASAPAGRVGANVRDGATDVPVDQILAVRAKDARPRSAVSVVSEAGEVAGAA